MTEKTMVPNKKRHFNTYLAGQAFLVFIVIWFIAAAVYGWLSYTSKTSLNAHAVEVNDCVIEIPSVTAALFFAGTQCREISHQVPKPLAR